MCLIDHGDHADVWQSGERRARHPHVCVECGRQISAGEVYFCHRMLFDGRWTTYNSHAACNELSEHIQLHLCGQTVFFAGALREILEDEDHWTPEVVLAAQAIGLRLGEALDILADRFADGDIDAPLNAYSTLYPSAGAA